MWRGAAVRRIHGLPKAVEMRSSNLNSRYMTINYNDFIHKLYNLKTI